MSSNASTKKKKNKNKNRIDTSAPTPASTATAPSSSSASSTSASSKSPAPAKSSSSKPAAPSTAKASHAAPFSSSSSSTTTAVAPRSLLLAAADEDDAPLIRGAPKHSAASASSAPSSSTQDDESKSSKDDILFGKKNTEEKKAANKKRKAESASSKKKKSKSGDDGDDDEDGPVDIFTGTTTSQTLKHLAEPLSHASLKPGMLVLGAVRAVNEVDLTVQLPHGLTGYVSMREVSDTMADIVDKYIEQGEKPQSDDTPAITLPILSDFIRIGQLVHCSIISVGEQVKEVTNSTKHSGAQVSQHRSRRIEISLRASLFNQNLSLASLHAGRLLYGSIKSVQEKGYMVDVGISDSSVTGGTTINAFLPFSKAPADELLPKPKRTGREKKKVKQEEKKEADDEQAEDEESTPSSTRKLCVGMPIQTVITNAQNKRVLQLSALPNEVQTCLMKQTSNESDAAQDADMDGATALKNTIGFTNLQPGMLVRGTIVSVIGSEEQKKTNAKMSGLYIRFLDFFHGIIDNLHSSTDASIEGSLESQYHETQRITCRILYINYITKKIALSLLPHIVAYQPFSFPSQVKCGDIIRDSIITKVEVRNGVYLRLPVKMDGVSQHKVEVVDEEEKKEQVKKEKKSSKKKQKSEDDDDEDMDGSDADEEDEDEEAESEENAADADAAMKDVDDEEREDVSGEQSLSAWVHISRLSDTHLSAVPKTMTIGSTLPCRILNLHYLDAMVHVSTQQHIMEQSILYYEDVKPGVEVQGEIVSVESFGVLLKLTPHITALIPSLHLSDIQLSDPSKKFKVNQILKARVLYVEERQKKIICTLKKNLLSSTLPKLMDYRLVKVGTISHGYIASVKDYGLIVEFYNKIHGLVSTQDLIHTNFLKPGQSPEAVFKRGDVHKIRIVYVDQKKQRMKCSLGLVASKERLVQEDSEEARLAEIVAPGKIVKGAVKEVKKDGLVIELDESEESATDDKKKKSKKTAQPVKSKHTLFLPSEHLTDHPSLSSALLHTYPVGHVFSQLFVLHREKSGTKLPIVSIKPSFLRYAKEQTSSAAAALSSSTSNVVMPSSYDSLQPGTQLLGFIRAITDFGVFLGFLDHVSALAPRSFLSDQFIAGDLNAAFHVGQTVRAKIMTVENKEAEAGVAAGDAIKVTVTLKPSQLIDDATDASDDSSPSNTRDQSLLHTEGDFISSFFRDTLRISTINSAKSQAIDWMQYPLAGAFNGGIKVIKDFGLVLEPSSAAAKDGEDSVQGLVTRPYHTQEPASKKELLLTASSSSSSKSESEISSESGEKYTLGQNVQGRILDVDRVKKIVDVTLRPELLEGMKAAVVAPAKGKKGKQSVTPAATPATLTLARGTSVLVRVQLVRKHYVVVSLPQHNHALGYAMTISTNARFNPHSVFTVGYETKAIVYENAKQGVDDSRMLLILDLSSALTSYSKNKKGANSGKSTTMSFIDPSVTKLGELQNGKKILVQIRGVTKSTSGAADSIGPNSRLEVLIGEVNGKTLTGSIHISELEDAVHSRAEQGDKQAKKLIKEHAKTPYRPLVEWAKKAGEKVEARIMNIERKVVKSKTDSKSASSSSSKQRTLISSINLSLRPSILSLPEEDTESGSSPLPLPHPTLSSLSSGQIVQVYVKDIELPSGESSSHPGAIWTMLAPKLRARVRVNELSFDTTKKVDLTKYVIGQALTVQVLDVHEEYKVVDVVLLPFGTTTPKKLDAAAVERVRAAALSMDRHDIKEGSVVQHLTVKRILPLGLLVSFGGHAHGSQEQQRVARIHITDLSDKWTSEPLAKFSVGQQIAKAMVIGVETKQDPVYRGAETTEDEDEEMADTSSSSSSLPKTSHQQIDLTLRTSRLAPQKATSSKYPEITSFDSLIGKEGTVIQGYVKTTSKAGCFIELSHSLTGRCLIKNLSDGYVKDPIREFTTGRFLPHVKIVKVDPETKTIELSLRKKERQPGKKGDSATAANNRYTFESVNEGDIVSGTITQIKPFGLFIRLKESVLSGLCHISEVSDMRIADLNQHYEIGDRVKAKIVKKEEKERRIMFGLKAKYFEGVQMEESEDEEEEAEVEADEEAEADADDADEAAAEDSDAEEEQMIEEDDDEEADAKSKSKRKSLASTAEKSETDSRKKQRLSEAHVSASSSSGSVALPSTLVDDGELADVPTLDLQASMALLTGASSTNDEEEADSDAEDELAEDDDTDGDSSQKKKSRRAKAGAKKAAERALTTKEHAILDPNAQPESADEFERIIVQNPNASMVWIKYMAYQISLTEIEKARKIAERALKSISFRSPQEKLNIWIALLNLENMYGTTKTMQEVFGRAIQFNEPQTVYMEVAKIYASTKKVEQCIETYEAALKKFHGAPSIFIAYGHFLYSTPGRLTEGRDLLKRALTRCEKSEHISLIMKFASYEFHLTQNVDRGRTLMEGVLSNYPKRIDLWNIYLDMEMKLMKKLKEATEGSTSAAKLAQSKDSNALNLESIRRLLDRITSLNLSTKKMKFFFKRYLTFEKENGADPERLEKVKTKAKEYVASKTSME